MSLEKESVHCERYYRKQKGLAFALLCEINEPQDLSFGFSITPAFYLEWPHYEAIPFFSNCMNLVDTSKEIYQ